MLVHVIADYGEGDLAFAEVAQRLIALIPDARLVYTPVAPFATLAAGFCIGQLGLNAPPEGTVIYHNVAPREDDDAKREENAGERLAFARLKTGALVVGVNAGHVYSFVRDAAEELGWAAAADSGSQFRSRDIFPRAAADLLSGKGGKAAPLDRKDIPDVPAGKVAYTDGYGNLKLTLRREDVPGKEGQKVRVTIGKKEMDAILSDGSFGVDPGQMALAPGSSGWPLPGGGKVEWLELFLRSGNASEAFGRPESGADVRIAGRA
ncbi:S-adenosyl-l-methionine hydroxide adenosyltransferase [Aquisphaera giovannonii]|uniref:S-adenosyl-l-methionine hydroxide adenosyltransferase n=1 Tax=Aquisphaera giovannonii TaxID=406548 RepID=A0A5B9VUK6_9BACT|nr:SAM hydroxide adenosyltransferase [Aquisphaera giovannonii]QEH31938.1 S-adenosyl-l-methionine hydroxide adenosyltransferase [Aquisphaera giovannonii]